MRIASRLDMVVPRAHALIRHRAERYNPDSIFDVGLALVRRDSEEREIERLRQALRYAPQDAISAAKLGELLLHNGDFREARHWLLEAQERCYRLPDRGNRVAQNLRQLERHMEQMRIHNRMAEELRIISVSSTGPAESLDHALDI
jgi:Flp pilus assembly protein TadD